MPSSRNKTIMINKLERGKYLPKIQTVDSLKQWETTVSGGSEWVLDRRFEVINRITYGDMFDICPLLPNGMCELIIADPPYNIDKEFNNGNAFHRMCETEYENYTRKWVNAVRPLLSSNGSIYVCCDWQCSSIISKVLNEYFTIKNRITWQRDKGRGAKNNWKNNMEDIWFAVNNPKNYTFNADAVKQRRKVIAPYRNENGGAKDWTETEKGKFRDTCCSNIWDDITIPFWSMKENTEHPTQKPEKLIAKLILASSNEGDVVLDPFLGSGTTSVVAKKLGRHYVGIEKDMDYCIIAEKRLEMAETDKRIQGYKDGVFLSRNAE